MLCMHTKHRKYMLFSLSFAKDEFSMKYFIMEFILKFENLISNDSLHLNLWQCYSSSVFVLIPFKVNSVFHLITTTNEK